MSGDYSRWTFDPRSDTATVLLQQGRILTDSDWNEKALTTQRRIQAEALDVIGRSGVPSETPDGFKITKDYGGLLIGPGRIYVDGILAENHGSRPDEWVDTLAELAGTEPVPYAQQPYLPEPPAMPAGKVLVYLKVWRREITAVENPRLIEPALGIDTSTRLQTVWQVKFLTLPAAFSAAEGGESIESILAAEPPATARLTVGTTATEVDPDPCQISPTGGYTGVENQLYRIEVHDPGPAGTATFKWSRDNATVAARVTVIPPGAKRDRIIVDRLGPDDVLSLHDGQLIEIIDDAQELAGTPGVMRRIASGGGVDKDTRTVRLTEPIDPAEFKLDPQGRPLEGANLRIRRWDQGTTVYDERGNQVTGPAVPANGAVTIPAPGVKRLLEHNITAEFSTDPDDGLFRTGDYWLIPARTADPTGHETTSQPPLGIHAHYAVLALIDRNTVTDLRTIFPPLTGLDALFYVTGDGQEVTPSTQNPVPLPVRPTVGVARGPIPVAGRAVRFARTGAGGGTINGGPTAVPPGEDPGPVIVLTGPDGLASVAWSVDPTVDGQTVQARLLDDEFEPTALPVRFSARTRRGGGHADGCSVTVGPGGDYSTLEEALQDPAARHNGDLSIRLLPADPLTGHLYSGSVIHDLNNLRIHGCVGSFLRLNRPIRIQDARDVELADFVVNATFLEGQARGIEISNGSEVRLERMNVFTAHDNLRELVAIEKYNYVRIVDNHFVASSSAPNAAPRAAITLSETSLAAWVGGNNIHGGISLYGTAGPDRINWLQEHLGNIVNGHPNGLDFELEGATSNGTLDVYHNTLSWMMLGIPAMPQQGIRCFSSARISDNSLTTNAGPPTVNGPIEVCAARVSFSGNDLGFRRPATTTLAGVVWADKATIVGNIGLGPDNQGNIPFLGAIAKLRAPAANAGLTVTPAP